jgi:hypothetical protein
MARPSLDLAAPCKTTWSLRHSAPKTESLVRRAPFTSRGGLPCNLQVNAPPAFGLGAQYRVLPFDFAQGTPSGVEGCRARPFSSENRRHSFVAESIGAFATRNAVSHAPRASPRGAFDCREHHVLDRELDRRAAGPAPISSYRPCLPPHRNANVEVMPRPYQPSARELVSQCRSAIRSVSTDSPTPRNEVAPCPSLR